MKKLLSIIAIALLIIPIRAYATITLYGNTVSTDDNGLITGAIYLNVEQGEVISDTVTVTLNAEHATIKSVDGNGSWTKDDSTILSSDGKTGTLVVKYSENSGIYEGKGERIQIGTITYVHDSEYDGPEECRVNIGLTNGTSVVIEEKKTPNAKTGSLLPYAGIVAGVSLIAAAYVISKKSNKLYKI